MTVKLWLPLGLLVGASAIGVAFALNHQNKTPPATQCWFAQYDSDGCCCRDHGSSSNPQATQGRAGEIFR